MNNKKAFSQPKENNRYQNLENESFGFEEEKNSEIKPPKKTRFDHLYENSKILQEKKEIYRIKTVIETKKKMNPKITKKAKQIERNKNLFHQRLFPKKNIKITLEHEDELIEEKDLYSRNQKQNEILKKIYKNNSSNSSNQELTSISDLKTINHNYTFKPEIDKKSKSIATKLPMNSKERLTLVIKQHLNDKKKEINEIEIKHPTKNIKVNQRSISLYQKGLEKMQKRNELFLKKQFEMNNLTPIKRSPKTITPLLSPDNVYARNAKWKEKLNIKNQKNKQKFNEKEKGYYTFHPNINTHIMEDDYRMINNNLGQYLSYVTKKRLQLKQKKRKEEQYYSNIKIDTKIGRTFIKEDSFIKYSNINTNKKRNKSQNNTIDVSLQRNKLGVDDFFLNREEETETYFNYSTYIRQNNFDINSQHEHSFAFSNAIQRMINNID